MQRLHPGTVWRNDFCCKENGFRQIERGSLPAALWLFIDIQTKLYVVGRPGVNIKEPVGGHALTPDEFMMIYEISKYFGNKKQYEFMGV